MSSKLSFASAAALVLVAGAIGGYFFYPSPLRAQKGAAAAAAKPPKVAYIDANELTMRLADGGGEHYIKLTPVLAVREADADMLRDRLPVLRDCIVNIVIGRQASVLATPEGEHNLKKDLLDALRGKFPGAVVDLYFSQYLVE